MGGQIKSDGGRIFVPKQKKWHLVALLSGWVILLMTHSSWSREAGEGQQKCVVKLSKCYYKMQANSCSWLHRFQTSDDGTIRRAGLLHSAPVPSLFIY